MAKTSNEFIDKYRPRGLKHKEIIKCLDAAYGKVYPEGEAINTMKQTTIFEVLNG